MFWRLVLTAAAGVTDAAAEAAALAFDGVPRRLGPCGVEIASDEIRAVEVTGLDANWVRAEGRSKRLLVADMDSTIIGCECIDEIAAHAGIGDRVAAITERAMAGELDFEAALAERVALLAGLPEAALAEVHDRAVRLNPGARVLVRTMAARGAATALVSGGFTFFTERVAAAAGFAEHRANTLEIAQGRLTGRVVPPVLGRDAKAAALEEIAARIGATPADAIAIGDGANDLAMVEAAGLGVAYRAKPALARRADARLDHSDLTAALHLQGIPEAEFVLD